MNNHSKQLLSALRDRAESRLDKSTPGEQAIIAMLMVISAQLEAVEETQETFAQQFNKISAGGNAILTEQA